MKLWPLGPAYGDDDDPVAAQNECVIAPGLPRVKKDEKFRLTTSAEVLG